MDIVSLLLISIFTISQTSGRKIVYGCEETSLDLVCDEDERIDIIRANYGRLSNSICSDRHVDTRDSWSTRCIQPTTLRHVTSQCGQDVSRCNIHVSSDMFGDPCPSTPKYLELVYTCRKREADVSSHSLNIPPWLLSLETMTDIIMEKNLQKPSSTPSPSTTSSTTSPPPIRLSSDYIRRPSEEFLLYIKQIEQTKKRQRLNQFLNRQPHLPSQSEDKPLQLDSALIAGVVTSVVMIFIIMTILVMFFTWRHRQQRQSPTPVSDEESASDATSTTSTYLQYSVSGSEADYSYVMDMKGRIYQVIPHNRLPTSLLAQQLEDSQHQYEDVDKISVLK